MNIKELEKRKYDYGIAILKIVCAFGVINCHFHGDLSDIGGVKTQELWKYLEFQAVPLFMLMSFYLCSNVFFDRDQGKLKDRFRRLLIPQVFWSVIYFINYNIIDPKTKATCTVPGALKDLAIQVLTGCSSRSNAAMWFQADLIMITVLVFLVFRLTKGKLQGLLNISVIAVFALFIQYSGINDYFNRLQFEFRYPFGRLAEMIPYAATGLLLAYVRDDMDKILGEIGCIAKWKLFVIITFLIVVICGYEVFYQTEGYAYSGIDRIVVAVMVLLLILMLPFDRLPKVAKKVIEMASGCTMGIYFFHNMIGVYFHRFMESMGLAVYTLNECLMIFFLCIAVILLIKKVPYSFVKYIL